ncbi:hypothetical protein Clacol_003716 [Clathrus columnatus]|uniref:Sm domain-containing protein n=1 Tax=Clathrus columnatus TaxID=1419009 RepID=A0AAV5AA13_9AGAM|nr:hypothetical protein Clacol_003716 [Clathrus columnatus]
MASQILPLGSRIWVIMKNDREFTGKLLGFDDFVMTPQGRKVTKLAQTLLNGNNICMSREVPDLSDVSAYTKI